MSSDVAISEVEPRTLRAITQTLSVLPEIGRAKGAEDLYLVVSQSGSEYLVDARDGSCECPDATHRDVECKHQRRVALETGQANASAIEQQLASTADSLEQNAIELEQQSQELAETAAELRDAIERLPEVSDQ